jgi:prepilin-type processing-associated H-X9-DG protein
VFLLTLAILATGCANTGSSRMNCGNNVKQLALGLQNYHDTFLYLPYGARNRTVKDVDGTSWGSSWLLATLPFCEQRPLFDKFYQADIDAPENDYQSAAAFQIANNQQIKYMVCQASPLPPSQSVLGSKIVVPSYVGIMGSTQVKSGAGTETRFVAGPYGGKATASGMLLINEALTFAACTDGTANTIIVGEVSNWYYDDNAAKRNPTLSIADAGDGAKPEAGWFAGNNLGMNKGGISETAYGGQPAIGADRVLNLVALEHPINTSNRGGAKDTDPNWGAGGIGRCGLNNPLSSAHGGGAMVGFLDGHVMLLPSKTDTSVLFMLACRDDGARLPPEF